MIGEDRIKHDVREFHALLDSSSEERPLQVFLEQHPWMLTCNHDVWPPVVITQLPLGVDYRPDFVFLWHHSGGEFIALVEIEPPRLQIFNADDEFSAPFNHALQQLEDWSSWLRSNSTYVHHLLEPLREFAPGTPTFRYIDLHLIVGRRSHLNSVRRRHRWEERTNRAQRDTHIRTYDGFVQSIDSSCSNLFPIICVRYSDRGYARVSEP
jgi:antiviral defense system Shedu protein SduA